MKTSFLAATLCKCTFKSIHHFVFAIVTLLSTIGASLGQSPTISEQVSPEVMSMVVGGIQVRAKIAVDRSTVVLSTSDKGEETTIELPEGAGDVSEFRLGSWMEGRGVVVIIETRNETNSQSSYSWAVSMLGKQQQLTRPMSGSILSSKVDLDVVGVVNPTSDTIYVMLTNIQESDQAKTNVISGYLYVNRCPAPATTGKLYRFPTLELVSSK